MTNPTPAALAARIREHLDAMQREASAVTQVRAIRHGRADLDDPYVRDRVFAAHARADVPALVAAARLLLDAIMAPRPLLWNGCYTCNVGAYHFGAFPNGLLQIEWDEKPHSPRHRVARERHQDEFAARAAAERWAVDNGVHADIAPRLRAVAAALGIDLDHMERP
jgi:hypothetical protein